MRVSWDFVTMWTKSPDQDVLTDRRGWQKGKRRRWSKADETRIERIHRELECDERAFYTGATAIAQRWQEQSPHLSPPPLITIGRIMRELGLSAKRKKGRNKGAAAYLCYPEHTIYTLLNGRVLEADFLGEKYLAGRTEPLNFIAFSFKKEPKLRFYRRVSSQTADCFICEIGTFFADYEKPDYVKVDNCLATIGSASGKRNLSRTMKFLLQNQVIPIFAVPRKPFSQASIEGNNSVFAKKFWNRITFKSIKEIDMKLEWFNASSEKYLRYLKPKKKTAGKKNFIPRIYFIRQVGDDNGRAYIDVLNEKISLGKSYIKYYVLAEWLLKTEKLNIYFEKNRQQKLIKQLSFEINARSKSSSGFI